MISQKTVAVLGCAPRSVYKSVPGADVFDQARDLRTFDCSKPVVAHPPCRAWSRRCSHQAKPTPGEKELAPLCVSFLRVCGGVLEHPAHSKLFDVASLSLPLPGEGNDDCWCISVPQAWWGHQMPKNSWLVFFGISRKEVFFPYTLLPDGGSERRWQLMSASQRSATPVEFARWLVSVAALTRLTSPERTMEFIPHGRG